MPWFEPSTTAPRYSAPRRNGVDDDDEVVVERSRRNGRQTNKRNDDDDDQIISLQDYLDVHWQANNMDDDNNTNNGNDDNSSTAMMMHHQGRMNNHFDAFQHRVEHQLGAAVFPSVASSSSSSFAALNSSLYQTNYYFNHSGGSSSHHHHHVSSDTISGSGGGGRKIAKTSLFSKTAQFFHPRKVMALQQYEDFFSPLVVDAAAASQEEANQMSINNECCNNENHVNSNATMNGFGLDNRNHRLTLLNEPSSDGNHNIQIQPRNLFVSSSQSSTTNDHHHSNNHSAAAASASHNNYNLQFQNSKQDKLPSIQATLRQDPATGQLLATSLRRDNNNNQRRSNDTSLLLGGGGKASSWENYGGRPLMDSTLNNGQSSLRESSTVNEERNEKKRTNKKKAKKKSKDKSMGKGGDGEKSEQRIDSIFQRKMGSDENDTAGNDDNVDDENGSAKKKKAKKTKKKRSYIDSSCELTVPTDRVNDNNNNNNTASSTLSSNSSTTKPKLTEQDFEGMTDDIMNAAQCMEGLQHFLSRVGQESHVAWTMIFLDPLCHYRQYVTDSSSTSNKNNNNNKRRKRSKKFSLNSDTAATIILECTTPFVPSNKRYCTDKGPTCTAWNCTCEDQIRAKRGGAPLLGAMFVLNKRDEVGGGGENGGAPSAEGGREGEKECYLLPLGPTEKCLDVDVEIEAGYSRMKSWPIIPFDCEVSLSDRWSAFEAIISNNQRKMVTYNATTALMPFYYHQFHDECNMNNAIDGDSQEVSQTDYMTSSSQFTSCLTGTQSQDDNVNQFQRPANLRSIWDLRLVSWMLRPDVSDDQMEWETFKNGFSHLAPDSTTELYEGMPIVSRGLMEARIDLSLLHSLYPLINEQLIRQDLLRSLENIEAPVQSILTSMECRGVGFYPQRLKKVESKLSVRINELEARSRAVTQDSEFLLSSPQQVSQYLFDKLKLNVPQGLVSKTKSSHRSTSEEALKAIKADAIARTGSAPEIIDIILEFRTLSKLLTTYIRPLPNLCVRGEGKSKKTPSRIHPQWMMTAVRTGRLSCRKPNLQQLPSDAVFGVKPRDAFVPSAREGMCVFACDYSQKEVRILAHMSNDEALISLFRGDANTDIYKQMASLIRNKPAESITSEERAQFKQVTLALLYGMSPNQVAKKLSISKSAAQQTMNDFFRRFRRVKSWMEETKQSARRNGYVLTIAGRRRYLNDIRSEDNGKRSQAERQAINTVIQGSAADLMKTAMIRLSENLQSWQEGTSCGGEFATATNANARPKMVLQIHDEVLLELRFNEEDIKKMQAVAVKSCCRDCEELFNLKVPLLLKCSCGLSFGSMKEI